MNTSMDTPASGLRKIRQPPALWLSCGFFAAAVTVALRTFVPVAAGAADAIHYRALAMGGTVPRPFAFRVLAPRLAALFASGTHHASDWGFHALGLASVFVLLFCLALPVLSAAHASASLRWSLLVAILLTPVIPAFWADLYLPDLLHAALLGAYLLLLRARSWLLAAALLPLLFLARESTVLLAVVTTLVLGRMVGRRIASMHVAAAALGWFLSQRAGALGQGNERGIGNAAYLLGKVPHNLLKNMLGASLWTEPMDGPRPPYLWTVPPGIHLGHIHQIGLVGVGFDLFYRTVLFALTTFGAGIPAAVLVWQQRARLWPMLRAQPWLVVAGVYGLLSLVLAPALGPSVDRLFAYAWPLFFMATPVLLLPLLHRPVPPHSVALLLLLQLMLCLLPRSVRLQPPLALFARVPHLLPFLLAVAACCWAADLLRPYTLPDPAANSPDLPVRL